MQCIWSNMKLDAQLRDRAKDNVPAERQRAGFVSYVELQKVKGGLLLAAKRGCCCPCMVAAFLLSGIIFKPVQYNLQACAIQLLKCDDDEVAKQALLHQVTPNEILLQTDRSAAGVLILREVKTQDRKHPVHQVFGK